MAAAHEGAPGLHHVHASMTGRSGTPRTVALRASHARIDNDSGPEDVCRPPERRIRPVAGLTRRQCVHLAPERPRVEAGRPRSSSTRACHAGRGPCPGTRRLPGPAAADTVGRDRPARSSGAASRSMMPRNAALQGITTLADAAGDRLARSRRPMGGAAGRGRPVDGPRRRPTSTRTPLFARLSSTVRYRVRTVKPPAWTGCIWGSCDRQYRRRRATLRPVGVWSAGECGVVGVGVSMIACARALANSDRTR